MKQIFAGTFNWVALINPKDNCNHDKILVNNRARGRSET